jgi:hypothetical protein
VVQEGRIAYGLTRAYFDYESDGLQVHAFVDIPDGQGPFPVVLVLHGYIDPQVYNTLTYTAHYANDFARRGFVAVHPNYRNYPPSDLGPNLFRVGYARRAQSGSAHPQPRPASPVRFEQADGEALGLFGHSMGEASPCGPSRSAARSTRPCCSAMSGNERWNFEKIQEWSVGARIEELGIPEADCCASPHLLPGRHSGAGEHPPRRRRCPGPPEWSDDLCARLVALGKLVECFSYPAAAHLRGRGCSLIQRAVDFFLKYLRLGISRDILRLPETGLRRGAA